VIAHGEPSLQILPFLEGWKVEIETAPDVLLLSRLATIFPSLVHGKVDSRIHPAGNGRKAPRPALTARAAE
jgi:hypothetical protein